MLATFSPFLPAAQVDLSSGGAALSKRFNLSSTPAAILFRDRSMYALDLAATTADADKIAAAVHAFMDGGYEHQVRGKRGD
jgi:hypothetical protein